MRSLRCTCISAQGYQFTPRYGHLGGMKVKIAHTCTTRILFSSQSHPKNGRKIFQVTINTGITFGMAHVYCIAKPVDTYRNVPHISIANREDAFPLYTTGLYIHTSMEVVGSRLAEVTCQHDGCTHRRTISYSRHQKYRQPNAHFVLLSLSTRLSTPTALQR